ncbi:MAG: class I SAM-dependent methyltransferase [Corynebacterium marinum]|uniref:Class I SAM-dependent methyltransferase n=1 Tax=Corynebacterium marinum TaxID=349751 RepID=A0A847HFU0_9CORY|nr:class I SAM-dependent methyltransferase [Corynebacterium marinum]
MTTYWNHSAAHHPWILRVAGERGRRATLDVGCGGGQLLQRPAPHVGQITGLEPDVPARKRATSRPAGIPNATVLPDAFSDHRPEKGYDLVTGDLLVVELPANRRVTDRLVPGLQPPLVRAGSRLHRESAGIGVPVMEPRENLGEIRVTVRRILPGARVGRARCYRCRRRWTKPTAAAR